MLGFAHKANQNYQQNALGDVKFPYFQLLKTLVSISQSRRSLLWLYFCPKCFQGWKLGKCGSALLQVAAYFQATLAMLAVCKWVAFKPLVWGFQVLGCLAWGFCGFFGWLFFVCGFVLQWVFCLFVRVGRFFKCKIEGFLPRELQTALIFLSQGNCGSFVGPSTPTDPVEHMGGSGSPLQRRDTAGQVTWQKRPVGTWAGLEN